MSATVTELRTSPRRTPLRRILCPRCGRFLVGATVEARGVVELPCRSCRRWLLIDVATGKEANAA